MRIAIMNSWPNIPQTAEAEWIRRALIACDRLGFEAFEVVTSDDILRCQPDCVLATHEYSTKLTHFPTLGLLWSPVSFYGDDPVRRRAILSYDGHLCGSRQIAQWVEDFSIGSGKRPFIHEGLMLPSAPDCGPARQLPQELAIMYAGVNWDGTRHGAIFRGLDGQVPLKLYGPPSAWADRGDSYGGTLPFDGVSVIKALQAAGIALCLHKAAHRTYNCPSMRLFEAAAAGALIITDDFDFPREWFRDCVLYIDADLPAQMVVGQIMHHVDWAHRNREAASRLAQRSNALFRRSLTLESMFSTVPEFVDRVRNGRHMVPAGPVLAKRLPVVEYIVRIGTRSAESIARALESLAAQTHQRIGVILVQFCPVDGLDTMLASFDHRFVWIKHLLVANTGSPATCLWAGLRAVTAKYFGVLDDDDMLFPNHVATAMAILERDRVTGLVYSGTITIEDEEGTYFAPFHFAGPAGRRIEERRDLTWIQDQNFAQFESGRSVIGPNAWIARQDLLDDEMLRDPKLETDEVTYLLALLASRTRPHFTATATAARHRCSAIEDKAILVHSADARSLRFRSITQTLDLPLHNRAPPLGLIYDAQKEVYGDAS